MTADRARRVESIYQAALDLPAEARPRFLDKQCAGDPELRAEVETLIACHDSTGDDLFDRPAMRLGTAGRKVTDPDHIGPYRILERLGEGGFGVVYAAEQVRPVRRKVAIKMLKAGMDTEAVLARFDAERQALALMDHPHIARVLDAGATEEGRPYFVMEMVRGESVTAYCDRNRLDTRRRLELFVPICLAVQHAHQKGVIHRDLKPMNVMVTVVDGRASPKVIDFGIAKALSSPLTDYTLHTVAGQLIGTPSYMSPEQAEQTGLDVDTRTDVYALGVILYELLTGQLPHDPRLLAQAGSAGIGDVIRDADPPPPSTRLRIHTPETVEAAYLRASEPGRLCGELRGELDWIVMRAMEKDRTRRYATAQELASEIRRHLDDEPVLAGPPSTTYRLRKFARRHRVSLAAAAAMVFGILAAAAGLTYALIESNHQRAQAQLARAQSDAVTDFLSQMLAAANPGDRGRDVTVREIMDEAGDALREEFADQPLVEARLRNVIGATYRELGEYDAADAHLSRAMELRGSLLGAANPASVNTMRELGLLARYRGDYAGAESTLTAVYGLRETALGADDPATIEALIDLGVLELRKENNEKAASIFEDSLHRLKRIGASRRRIQAVENDLALAYQSLGRYDEAERLFVACLDHDLDRYGPHHIETLSTQQNLASLYRELGRFEQATPLYEAAVEAARVIFGEEHPQTLRAKSNLGLLYQDAGRYPDAEAVSREVVDVRRRTLGPDHPSTLVSEMNLGLLYLRCERYPESVRLLRDTVARCRATVGADHLYTLAAENSLGTALHRGGDPAAGEAILRSVVERSRLTFPAGHWRIGIALVRHGDALAGLGRFEEAEAELLEGAEFLEAALGADHDRTREAVTLLVTLYDRWGRAGEKRRWEARAGQPAVAG